MKNIFLQRLIVFFIFSILIFSNLNGQSYLKNTAIIKVVDSALMKNIDEITDEIIISIFKKHKVFYYEKAFPFSRNAETKQYYEVRFEGSLNALEIDIDKIIQHGKKFTQFLKLEELTSSESIYSPTDHMWSITPNDSSEYLWYLKKIKADLAWDITKGSPDIKVAVIDRKMDITHPDLFSKIYPHYDPYDNTPFACLDTNVDNHGTMVASLVAGETTEMGGVSNGQLASIGFNTRMIGYVVPNTMIQYLQKALHASSVMGARVLISCATPGVHCYEGDSVLNSLIMKEILDNGTVIVVGAGNGTAGYGCIEGGNYQPFYPFHPKYDNRVIIVSSTGRDDKHEFKTFNETLNDWVYKSHAHFPEVDVCAPGYGLMVAKNTNCTSGGWPYEGNAVGTSFSSPIVAGLAALVLSVNPCLTPFEVKYIIKSTTDPIVDAANFPNMLGTGRINAYKAVKKAQELSNTDIYITSMEGWNDNRFISSNVIIEAPATLEISGKIQFAEGKKIIVKPGGRLILNGGHLTSSPSCGKMWGGVEVWGNYSRHQQPYVLDLINPLYYQGRVELKNDAIIENANVGIRLWKPEDYNSTGGFVRSNKAQFINNRRSVEFISYHNFNPTTEMPMSNVSYFFETSFIINSDYLGDVSSMDFLSHITMWDVEGVRFRECSFEDRRISPNYGSSSFYAGIYTIDANFRIIRECAVTNVFPCPSYTNNTLFKGMKTGVYVSNSSSSKTVNIQYSDFVDNFSGVYLSAHNNAVITDNNFIIGGNKGVNITGLPIYTGCFFAYSTGYNYQKNNHSKSSAIGTYNLSNIGEVVAAGGAANSRIFKNTYSNLSLAHFINGVNRNATGTQGLDLICNNYSSLDGGWSIIPGGTLDLDGVKLHQGSATASAGNVFTGITGTGVFNQSLNTIIYYHTNGATDPTVSGSVVKTNSTIANSCNSNNSPAAMTTFPLSEGEIHLVYKELHTAQEAKENLMYTLKLLFDGGDSEKLINEIRNTWASSVWILRDSLLSKSPYLTSEVLMEVVNNREIPNAVALELFLLNPDATRPESFLNEVQFKALNPLPSYMIEVIRESWNSETARTLLESKISYLTGEESFLQDLLLTNEMLKEEDKDIEFIRSIYKKRNNISDVYLLADSYIEEADFDKALEVVNLASERFELSKDVDYFYEEYKSYVDYLYFRREWAMSSKNIAQLNELEVAGFYEFARSASGVSRIKAFNILCFFYQICESIKLEDDLSTKAAKNVPQPLNIKQLMSSLYNEVSVYPNPVSTVTLFDWKLPLLKSKANILIYDISGKIIVNHVIDKLEGQWTWDVSNVSAGTYIYEIIGDDRNKLVDGKIVVVK